MLKPSIREVIPHVEDVCVGEVRHASDQNNAAMEPRQRRARLEVVNILRNECGATSTAGTPVTPTFEEELASAWPGLDRIAAQFSLAPPVRGDAQLLSYIDAANRLLAAPKPDDRYAALLEKMESLEREFASQSVEEAPAPEPQPEAVKTTPAPTPNRGIFAWLRGRAA